MYFNEKLTHKYIKNILPGAEIIVHHYMARNDYGPYFKKYIYVDFYFEFNNKKYIIEYNGGQHYKFIPFFHRTKDEFKKQKERDRWLKRYCKQNRIKLIIIDGRKYTKELILIYLQGKFK